MQLLEKLEKLAAAGIELIPSVQVPTHFIFHRDGFVALVERRGEGFGGLGASGLLTEHGGLAPLIWREGVATFVGKGGFEQPATAEQVIAVRAFAADLKAAIED
jgi:hypothetical protein